MMHANKLHGRHSPRKGVIHPEIRMDE